MEDAAEAVLSPIKGGREIGRSLWLAVDDKTEARTRAQSERSMALMYRRFPF